MERRMGIIALATAAIGIGCIGILSCLKISNEAEAMAAEQKYYMPNSTYYYTDYQEYLQALADREAYLKSEDESDENETEEVSEDEYLLAKIAMAEAEGEDTEGKALVICVVLNRAASDDFPDTIEEVIYQEGQFASVGSRWDVEPDEDCYAALDMVLAGWDESQGALYFESTDSESSWHRDNLTYLFEHGGHIFYR